jgi:hypothetical protein
MAESNLVGDGHACGCPALRFPRPPHLKALYIRLKAEQVQELIVRRVLY